MMAWRIVVWLVAGCAWLHAQEVRRALPVGPGSLDNYENPAWVDQVQLNGEVEVRRALPVEPVSPPASTPVPAVQEVKVADEDAQNGIIRIAPSAVDGGTDSVLGRANSFFARGMHDLAIPEYELFLVSGGKLPGRDAAMFRLAESHRALGNNAAARVAYEKLLMEFQTGEFAAAGAYRLGGILFAEKLHDASATQFDLAAREASDPGVRLSAAYFAGRSHDAAGRIIDAANRYEAVLSAEGENVYRDNAAMALGAIQLKRGERNAALLTFEKLARTSSEGSVTASAAMEASTLALDAGKTPLALEMLGIAAKRGDVGIRTAAWLQSLRLRHDSGDHAGVVAAASEAAAAVSPDRRAEVMRIHAASLRATGDNAGAASVYGELLDGGAPSANPELRYQRLLALHAAGDKSLPVEIDAFVAANPDSPLAASATLLKAEALFQQGDNGGAARAYGAAAKHPRLKEAQRPAALYKKAWSLSASGDISGAVAAYGEFVSRYPQDKLAPGALLQSGIARQKTQDFEGALGDFNRVLGEYPLSAEVELSLLQKALTSGQLKRNQEMDEAFRRLLEKYPKTAAAAQANYWIGWVAYENNDMAEALRRLAEARRLDAKTYGDRATLRIILARYQQQDFPAARAEFEGYRGAPLPPEVLVWIARGHAASGNHAKVEETLKPLLDGGGDPGADGWILAANSRVALGLHNEAADAATRYLGTVNEPASLARGHLARAKALLGIGRMEEARRDVDQVLFLQPEGRLNAEGRLLSGEVFFAVGDYDSAARSFMAVSVLTDDPELTPRALRRAADAYSRTFNDAEAENALKELRQRFPSSPLANEA